MDGSIQIRPQVSFCCHEDTSVEHMTRISIEKKNRIAKHIGRAKSALNYKTSE